MKVNDMMTLALSFICMMSGLVLFRIGTISFEISMVLMVAAIVLLFYSIWPRGKKKNKRK